MPDIPDLKIKYKISEDGKTVMLLSPNDPGAESAKEGELQFSFNSQEISLGYPVQMDFVLEDIRNVCIGIDYLTSQLLQDKDAVAENFAVNANGKGQHREQVYITENYPHPEWRKVKHLRFADEKACRYVTGYLKSIDFNEHYKYILRHLENIDPDRDHCLLEKTAKGIKVQEVPTTTVLQDLPKALKAHAKALSVIKDEFIELLRKEYVSTEKSLKKPVLKVQKRGELIKISQRNPESMQSVLTKLFYWIMDKLRGISDLKIKTKIVEGEEKGTYRLKVMLSGRKAHEIAHGIIGEEKQSLVHEAFNLDGEPEALRAFIDELKKLNPEQQVETYNAGLVAKRQKEMTEAQQANLTVAAKDVYQELSEKAQEALEKKCKKDVTQQSPIIKDLPLSRPIAAQRSSPGTIGIRAPDKTDGSRERDNGRSNKLILSDALDNIKAEILVKRDFGTWPILLICHPKKHYVPEHIRNFVKEFNNNTRLFNTNMINIPVHTMQSGEYFDYLRKAVEEAAAKPMQYQQQPDASRVLAAATLHLFKEQTVLTENYYMTNKGDKAVASKLGALKEHIDNYLNEQYPNEISALKKVVEERQEDAGQSHYR